MIFTFLSHLLSGGCQTILKSHIDEEADLFVLKAKTFCIVAEIENVPFKYNS
jgi:hypothetical protein